VRVWGEYACFTRPEMKVERVTYPVMTPSGARGVLEAILWKPEFAWRIQEIHVLRDIAYFSILRNEVGDKQSARAAQRILAAGDGYYAEEHRQQRHTLALRNVAYLIQAEVVPKSASHADRTKYREMFVRRVANGQCWHQPYLGCREFTAFFAPPDPSEAPIDRTESLGRMLFDLEYGERPPYRPRFFDAELTNGVLKVPPSLYGDG
jgi:CRISPR-associated protein Cas5d